LNALDTRKFLHPGIIYLIEVLALGYRVTASGVTFLTMAAVIVANSDFWAMLLLSCTTAITGGMHGKEDQV
jgi:hypothetical protein